MITVEQLGIVRAPKLDPQLEPVDRLAVRWAKGDHQAAPLHPLEAMRLLHDGAVLGGGPSGTPEDIAKFDQCFIGASGHDKSIIHVWYRTGGSVQQKAGRLGIGRGQLYVEWGRTLSYFRGWLRAHNLNI